jgi:hypothetical protein
MANKKKVFDVGKKVRHISREVFVGKLPTTKAHKNKRGFNKADRAKGKCRRIDTTGNDSFFYLHSITTQTLWLGWFAKNSKFL